MRSFFYTVSLAAVGSAAVIKRDQCCFQLTASGDVSGVMGQLNDGQNRLNGTYPAATYCLSNGGITDASGRGCIVTTTNDATHQFQCDEGTAAQTGFTISTNGSLSFDSSDQFYACPYNNGEIIEYNVYTQALAGQDKCRPVKLSTGGKCATSALSCGVVTTTVYAAAPTYADTSVQSDSIYSSASAVMTIANSISMAVSSVPGLASTMEALPTPKSIFSAISVSGYATSTGSREDIGTSIEATAPAYETSASQIAYSSESGMQYSSVTIVAAESQPTAPLYSVPLQTPEIATTYSISGSIAPSTTVVSAPAYSATTILSVSASRTASSTPAASFSSVVFVTSDNGYSEVLSSSWTTIATSTISSGMAGMTSSVAFASTDSEASATVPITSTSASVCQTALTGSYETPHLIVPLSSSSPDTAYGTQYDAYVNSDNSTIFNFDIPASYEGMTCTTIFLFPELADLETSSYTFSGSGNIVFSELSAAATEETTYNTAPSVTSVLSTIAIEAGSSYVVASGPCAAGTTVSIELSSQNGLSLEFFEDWNPSSLGLYITSC